VCALCLHVRACEGECVDGDGWVISVVCERCAGAHPQPHLFLIPQMGSRAVETVEVVLRARVCVCVCACVRVFE
jgi:hypothetical protein